MRIDLPARGGFHQCEILRTSWERRFWSGLGKHLGLFDVQGEAKMTINAAEVVDGCCKSFVESRGAALSSAYWSSVVDLMEVCLRDRSLEVLQMTVSVKAVLDVDARIVRRNIMKHSAQVQGGECRGEDAGLLQT